jgi:hypothetical protein
MELSAVVGSSWANSYVESLQEADEIVAELPASASTAWDGITDDAYKQQILMGGAEFMSLALTLKGYKAYHKQRLAFPRKDCQEHLGFELSEIPYAVKRAQVYCAVFIVHRNNASLPSAVTGDTEKRGVASFSISGLSISLKDNVAGAGTIEEYIKSAHLPLFLMLKDFITQAKGGAVKHRQHLRAVDTTSTTTSTTTTTETTTTTTVGG